MGKTFEQRLILRVNEWIFWRISRTPRAQHGRTFYRFHFLLSFYYVLLAFFKTPLWLAGRGVNRYVTAQYENEGIGGQFCRYLSARFVAQKFGVTFVHRPFEISFHDGEVDWERFLNLEPASSPRLQSAMAGCKHIQLPEFGDLMSPVVSKFLTLIIRYAHPESNVVFVLPRFSAWPFDLDPELLRSERNFMKERYHSARRTALQCTRFAQGKTRVAVVVRRGEIAEMLKSDDRYKQMRARSRWLESGWYIEVLQQLIDIFGKENLTCQVFSDERERVNLKSISDLMPGSLDLLVDDPKNQPLRMFHSLTTADIVVCGLTGCCFPAGLISEGVKLRPSKPSAIYFPELEDWIPVDESGGFDKNALNQTLARCSLAKPPINEPGG